MALRLLHTTGTALPTLGAFTRQFTFRIGGPSAQLQLRVMSSGAASSSTHDEHDAAGIGPGNTGNSSHQDLDTSPKPSPDHSTSPKSSPHHSHSHSHSHTSTSASSGANLSPSDLPRMDPPFVPISRNEWFGFDAGSASKTRVVQGGPVDLQKLREQQQDEIDALSEVVQHKRFVSVLETHSATLPHSHLTLDRVGMTREQCMLNLTAGIATQILHKESRITSLLGEGFYTIGPCGEEVMSTVAFHLRPTDTVALHYRHLATQVARRLLDGNTELDDILLDRARGHVVSMKDPVTGGVHCSLGGTENDFVSTSTLASQAPPAVGRALGISLAHRLKVPTRFPRNAISYVSVGDGSVNNAHFLAAVNTAEYAAYRGYRCPVVFAISDNDLCISLKGFGWLTREFLHKFRMPVFEANGWDMLDVFQQSRLATETCRKLAKPVALIIKDLPRRFGHAATDRQAAYLTEEEIRKFANDNPLLGACAQAVDQEVTTWDQLLELTHTIDEKTRKAFDEAAQEDKVTQRSLMLERLAPKVQPKPHTFTHATTVAAPRKKKSDERPTIMRKNMNRVMDELLEHNPEFVYIGEDVVHGGYYIVTEGLAQKYPYRVRDFPPDETSLLGAALGYAQAGLVPIVEIPYAKYLDCGFDMLTEIGISHWLSRGRNPAGMIIRLQGFGQGVFGGNFHTHNMLHNIPGIDVVCYSNGEDYAKGWRFLARQAKAGRVVMSVDSTHLLAQRHVHEGDDLWRRPYPGTDDELGYDEVVKYGKGNDLGIVSYGSGVLSALRVRDWLHKQRPDVGITVVDSPYLSSVQTGLQEAVKNFDRVVFVDICKQGQHPFGGLITQLQSQDALPVKWQCVASQPTYNPLGQTLTFVSDRDVVESCVHLLSL